MLKEQTQPLVVQLGTEHTAGWSVWNSLLYGREILVIKSPKLSAGEPLTGVRQLTLTVVSEEGNCQLFQIFSCKAEA